MARLAREYKECDRKFWFVFGHHYLEIFFSWFNRSTRLVVTCRDFVGWWLTIQSTKRPTKPKMQSSSHANVLPMPKRSNPCVGWRTLVLASKPPTPQSRELTLTRNALSLETFLFAVRLSRGSLFQPRWSALLLSVGIIFIILPSIVVLRRGTRTSTPTAALLFLWRKVTLLPLGNVVLWPKLSNSTLSLTRLNVRQQEERGSVCSKSMYRFLGSSEGPRCHIPPHKINNRKSLSFLRSYFSSLLQLSLFIELYNNAWRYQMFIQQHRTRF